MAPPHVVWAHLGIALRYAEDLGAHRKKVYNSTPTVGDELLKRAFWSVTLDHLAKPR